MTLFLITKNGVRILKEVTGYKPSYPIIGDENLHVAKLYGLLPGSTSGSSKGRTAADNQTVRTVYVIGPDKKVKLLLTYPMATGRNFLEILRVYRFYTIDGEV